MTLDYLLRAIRSNTHIQISEKDIQYIPEFKEEWIFNSFESLLLQSEGHQPIKTYTFSKRKVFDWCMSNYIEVHFDKHIGLIHFKYNKEGHIKDILTNSKSLEEKINKIIELITTTDK